MNIYGRPRNITQQTEQVLSKMERSKSSSSAESRGLSSKQHLHEVTISVVESGDESNDRTTEGEITRNQESMMHDLDSYLEENILKDNSWGDSAEKSTKQDYS